VESGELDAGIVSAPPQFSRALEVTHRFADEFTVIVPAKFKMRGISKTVAPAELSKIFAQQRWLLIGGQTTTGKRLQGWLSQHGVQIQPAMEADNFDLIANLVSLGLGVSIVPHRVLALYPNRRPVQRINTKPKFTRDLIVVVRRRPKLPHTLAGFVQNILFS
jgi:DNA-binding transcriptional LysR family regulator